MNEVIINNFRREFGARLKAARQECGLTQSEVAEQLSNKVSSAKEKLDPNFDQLGKMFGRYKQWEYGNNTVPSHIIPHLCEILGCDAGYLFGEYAEKQHLHADICSSTGLSENAAKKMLQEMAFSSQISSALHDGIRPHTIMSRIVEDPEFWRILNTISTCTTSFNTAIMNSLDSESLNEWQNFETQSSLEAEYTPFADPMRDVQINGAVMHFGDVLRRALRWEKKKEEQ